MIKGLSTTSFPSPFGVDGDVLDAFAVINDCHAHGVVGKRAISAAFDIYASEAAYDAGKRQICKHVYSMTEIYEGTVVNSMDEFFDAVYQVVLANDPCFTDGEVVNFDPE